MILDKSSKTIQWGKRQSLQQIVLGKSDIHMQRNELGPLPYTTPKNYLKMDQTPKGKTVKILGENTGEIFHDIGFGNGFLDMTPKAQATKEKKKQVN